MTTDLIGSEAKPQFHSKTVSVLERKSIADSTILLKLERPHDFQFVAGLNLDLTLPDCDNDQFSGKRTLSIASAPYEPFIELAIRTRPSPFKEAVAQLEPGDPVRIDGPYGTFGLRHDASTPAVFIAGGIGITPFLSIIRQMKRENWSGNVYLFYSNRRRAISAYIDEFQSLGKEESWFNLIPVFTRISPDGSFGSFENGRVTPDMIRKHVPDVDSAHFYVVGGSEMVWSMVRELDSIAPRERITVEDFTGF